jgi:predicted DNA-binding transcriptional regulator YafY
VHRAHQLGRPQPQRAEGARPDPRPPGRARWRRQTPGPAAKNSPSAGLAERRKTCYYSASRDSEDTRTIDSYHFTFHNGGLYLVGHCHLPNALKIFAVERIPAA